MALPEPEPLPAAVETAAARAATPARAARVDLVELVGAQAARTGGDPAGPFVRCADVWKSYGHRTILQGVDFTVQRGDVVTLMGPSGSGKSTLLRLIAHLEPLDRGEITVGGELVGYERVRRRAPALAPRGPRAGRARIGMVFQQFNLFEHLTALENICEAPVRVHGERPEVARARATSCCRAWGSPTTPITCRRGSPAASSSGWPSRGRWPSRRG